MTKPGRLTAMFGAIGVLALYASLLPSRSAGPASILDGAPRKILWAWERPEDLRFADARTTGVAFLAKTIVIRADASQGPRISVRPRMQPLRMAEGTWLMAVARIESGPGAAMKIPPKTRRGIAQAIAGIAALPHVRAVQVDYDARATEREFYRALLVDLRAALPAQMPLSITALASWCLGDNWMDGLPVDEAVPMLFQMGPETTSIRLYLTTGGSFSSPLCQSSLGLATNEPLPRWPEARRTYLWNPRRWSADVAAALAPRDRGKQ